MDTRLQRLGIPASAVKSYDQIMKSHLTTTAAVAEEDADQAIVTEQAAHKIDGIDTD